MNKLYNQLLAFSAIIETQSLFVILPTFSIKGNSYITWS